MHLIDGDGHYNGTFRYEDAQNSIPPTVITTDWLNAVQAELAYAIQQSGLSLSKPDNTQLYQAILRLMPLNSYVSVTHGDTIGLQHAGKLIFLISALPQLLPAVSDFRAGACLFIESKHAAASVACASGETIQIGQSSVSSLSLAYGESVWLMHLSGGVWQAFGGTVLNRAKPLSRVASVATLVIDAATTTSVQFIPLAFTAPQAAGYAVRVKLSAFIDPGTAGGNHNVIAELRIGAMAVDRGVFNIVENAITSHEFSLSYDGALAAGDVVTVWLRKTYQAGGRIVVNGDDHNSDDNLNGVMSVLSAVKY